MKDKLRCILCNNPIRGLGTECVCNKTEADIRRWDTKKRKIYNKKIAEMN